MITTPDDPGFAALTRLISSRVGLTLEAYKSKCLRRRIAVRMRACGAHTYDDYRRLLDASPAELERLADALTINVTRFYRNPETWEVVRRTILPDLIERRAGRIRCWSAGCASGEEPYTLAMLCLDTLAERGRGSWADRIRIEASDIDRRSLERAEAGVYRPDAFSELPDRLRERYVEPAGDQLAVRSEVKALVRIGRMDLGRQAPEPESFDLILCRNVVIYFDRPTQERLFAGFADGLRPGGYLVLGKVETLFGTARDRLTMVDPRERVYRRPL